MKSSQRLVMPKVQDSNSTPLLYIQKPRNTNLRWVVLIFSCINFFGHYYNLDNPQSIQTYAMKKYNLSSFQYNLLYSCYSFPNMILPLFGGSIVDYFGVRRGLLLFTSILLCGSSLVAFGAGQDSFMIMVLGRILYGFGGENMNVCQNVLISKWFRDKELGLAVVINMSVGALGSSVNSWLIPELIKWTGNLRDPLLSSVSILLIGLICSIIIYFLDKYNDIKEGPLSNNNNTIQQDQSQFFKVEYIKKFSRLFWILGAICFLIYSSFYPFINMSNDYISTRFGFNNQSAGQLVMIIFLQSTLISPVFGYLVDQYGIRIKFMFLAYIFLYTAHILFAFLPNYQSPAYIALVPICSISLFYSVFCSTFWSSIAVVTDIQATGTAFGLITSIQNVGLTFTPLIVGFIRDQTFNLDHKYGYSSVSLFLLFLAVLGTICTVVLYINNSFLKGPLDSVPNKLGQLPEIQYYKTIEEKHINHN